MRDAAEKAESRQAVLAELGGGHDYEMINTGGLYRRKGWRVALTNNFDLSFVGVGRQLVFCPG